MAWEVEYTDEFEVWWINELDHAERESAAAYVALLEDRGPALYANHLVELIEEGLIDEKEVS